jgi:DNA-binding NarL/FixJ family response regulator
MKRAIVVADNSLIVGAIRAGLRDSGAFQLLGYIDARNASAGIVRDAGADVVLVDEADRSEEVIALIRSVTEANDDITVMVLTVRMEGEWLHRALNAGASGAISKAVHPAALATLVREVLSGHIVHAPASITAEHETLTTLAAEHSSLTGRELEILQLVAYGATNGEIARRLWITQQTVKFHVSNIYRKLDVANRTEACHYAHVNKLVAPRETLRLGFQASPDQAAMARREPPPRTSEESDADVSKTRLDVPARTSAGACCGERSEAAGAHS